MYVWQLLVHILNAILMRRKWIVYTSRKYINALCINGSVTFKKLTGLFTWSTIHQQFQRFRFYSGKPFYGFK